MDSGCGNADLGAQAKAEAIGETWTGIVEDTGAIDLFLEVFGGMV